MKKGLLLLLLCILSLALLTSCGGDPSAETTDDPSAEQGEAPEGDGEEKILTMSESSGSPSGVFNPLFISDEYDREVCEMIFEALVEVDSYFNVTPCLAESWEISEDNRTVTFHLRQDVTWQDGEPFTADDVVFTYDLLCAPDVNTFYGSYASVLQGYEDRKSGAADHCEGIQKVDDYTVTLTTTEPYGLMLTGFVNYIRIIPEHIWGAVDPATMTEQADLMRNPVGTNCFQLTEFQPDEYLIFDRYDDYWGGVSEIDRIIMRIMTADASLAAALNGELDFGRISSMNPDDIAMYEEAGFTVEQIYYNSTQMMTVNNSNPLLSDKRVRQAFAYAIDRAGIVENLVYGYGTVANQPYREGLYCRPDDADMNLYEYNSAEALRILTEEVGWEYRDGVMYADGTPVEFTLIYPEGNVARMNSAPVIQEQLGEIGIGIELEIMEFSTLGDRCAAGDFDLALQAQGSNDPNLRAFYNDGIYNYAQYYNQELDDLFVEAMRHVDQEEQATYLKQAALIMNEDMPSIYLYHWYDGRFVANDLAGVQCTALTNFYQLINWHFE